MNPLTQVKRIQKINSTEAKLGISDEASWHAKYKGSAYIFAGGIPFQLTEGDLLAIFAQYGEVVDVNLIRDKATGKSRGFAFLAYEDQRSTILAVDNLNGASILGRIMRVDHVSNYKKKEEEEEDEEKERQKREARGVCYAFQRGECNRGASCKFSHDEQRNANTGWGSKESNPKWDHDKYKDPPKSHNKYRQRTSDHSLQHRDDGGETRSKSMDKHVSSSRSERNHVSESLQKESHWKSKDQEGGDNEKLVEKERSRTREKEDRHQQTIDKLLGRRISEQRQHDDADRRGSEKRTRDRDSSLHSRREKSEQYERGSYR